MTKRDRRLAAWLLLVLGAIFLISGLAVILFATMPLVQPQALAPAAPPAVEPSLVVTVANLIFDFMLRLLQVEWTPQRIGVFLVGVGLLLEAGGIYLLAGGKRSR